MLPGKTLVWIALIASLLAMAGFLRSCLATRAAGARRRLDGDGAVGTTDGIDPWLLIARAAHGVALVALLGAVAWLMRLLLTHQFQFSYVYRYSSRDLPLHYLISTFWAGQEGTFLLWATWTALLGLIATRTLGKFEAGVMTFVMLLQSGLLLILTRLSPFALYPMTPPDGAGLNPLLQDPWMVIHPPMLFLGFASTAIPAAFALNALARREADDWVRGALPWVAFSVLVLGTPICLGGYWAYKVLGWGGYWGWDPVENGSLVPWLVSVALLHGLVVQKRRGVMKRLNLFLAISPFMLVLYATFLTRSGILGDFSVHSFVDLGINGYLVAFLVGYTLLAVGLYAWRVRGIQEPPLPARRLTREFGMFLGALSLALFAVIVLLGTSAPLLTRFGGGAPANVATSYYVNSSLPFAGLLCLLLTVVPRLAWGRLQEQEWFAALRSPVLLGALSTLLLYLGGVRRPQHLAVVGAAGLAFFLNVEVLLGLLRRDPATAGGYLVHSGVALMIVGIISSTAYSASDSLVMPRGQTVEAFGYKLMWKGVRAIEGGREEAYDVVVITERGHSFTASPVMFHSEYSKGVMRRPAIHRFLQQDLYLSPQGVDRDGAADRMEKQELSLTQGESETLGDRIFSLRTFEPRTMTPARIEIAAVVAVTTGDRTEIVRPVITVTEDGQKYDEVRLTDGTKLLMRRMDPGTQRALFYLRAPDSPQYDRPIEALIVDVSIKPWINVLWLGTFLCIGGLLMTVVHRARLARKEPVSVGDEEWTSGAGPVSRPGFPGTPRAAAAPPSAFPRAAPGTSWRGWPRDTR